MLLTDDAGWGNGLNFRIFKFKRVFRSVLGGEARTFSDAFYMVYPIGHDLEKMINRNVALSMVTDFYSFSRWS